MCLFHVLKACCAGEAITNVLLLVLKACCVKEPIRNVFISRSQSVLRGRANHKCVVARS